MSPQFLVPQFPGNDKLEEEASKIFAAYPQNIEHVDAANFVWTIFHLLKIHNLTKSNIFLKDIHLVDGALACWTCEKNLKKVIQDFDVLTLW